jgi:hypothetical protein
MDLRTARYMDLFGFAFFVGGAFHLALFLAGVAMALLNPSLFYGSGAGGQHVVARSPVEALGVVFFFGVFALVFNLMVSAGGAGAFIGFRKLNALLRSMRRSG